ncbi:MAG TPA: hypothetical protein DCF91_01040 [Porphyromonadaceae bacterium]|nr:hypothetical protein [Porphyromonadaceae bacterium]
MKHKFYIIGLFLIGSFLLISCDREGFDYGTNKPVVDNRPEGSVSLASIKLDLDLDFGFKTKAEESSIDVNDFIVRIFDKDHDNKLVKEWKYSEMPEVFSLKVGNYNVAAYSHEQLPAEFDRPFIYGMQSFVIKENSVTDIETLRCVLRSIMVTVEYDDALQALLGDDVLASVRVGTGELQYDKNNKQAGHFIAQNDAQNLLTSTLAGTIDGEKVNISKAFPDVKAGEHRIIKYTLKGVGEPDPEGGSASISMNIDMSCTVADKDVVINPGEDVIPDEPSEPGNPGEGGDESSKPTIVGKDFDITKPLVLPAGGTTVVVNITAKHGINNLFVEIDSETLTEDILQEVGLAKSFDLADPGVLAEALSSLGFPIGADVVGKNELVFDITQFTPLLGIYGAGTHNFIITVVDQANPANTKKQTLTLITE